MEIESDLGFSLAASRSISFVSFGFCSPLNDDGGNWGVFKSTPFLLHFRRGGHFEVDF